MNPSSPIRVLMLLVPTKSWKQKTIIESKKFRKRNYYRCMTPEMPETMKRICPIYCLKALEVQRGIENIDFDKLRGHSSYCQWSMVLPSAIFFFFWVKREYSINKCNTYYKMPGRLGNHIEGLCSSRVWNLSIHGGAKNKRMGDASLI